MIQTGFVNAIATSTTFFEYSRANMSIDNVFQESLNSHGTDTDVIHYLYCATYVLKECVHFRMFLWVEGRFEKWSE